MEISQDNRLTFNNAFDQWGKVNQIEMVKEELTELLLELLREKRRRTTDDNIIEEIADVQIMIWQAAMIYGESQVDKKIDEKMQRLRFRLLDSLNNE